MDDPGGDRPRLLPAGGRSAAPASAAHGRVPAGDPPGGSAEIDFTAGYGRRLGRIARRPGAGGAAAGGALPRVPPRDGAGRRLHALRRHQPDRALPQRCGSLPGGGRDGPREAQPPAGAGGAEPVPDGAGGWQERWVALGTLWARSRRARRRDAGGEAALSRARYRIVVRAAPRGRPRGPGRGSGCAMARGSSRSRRWPSTTRGRAT